MTQVKNMDDLNTQLGHYIKRAMTLTRDTIFEVLWQEVNAYYEEPVFGKKKNSSDPTQYSRTGTLMNSFNGGNVVESQGVYSFTVGFDDDYLRFTYAGNPKQKKSLFNPATGLTVLHWFNGASHGGTVTGNHEFWNEGIAKLGGEQGITNLFLRNLRRVGLSVS